MNRLVDHPVTAWADPLGETSVRAFGTSRYTPALDNESAAVDPAHRSFGAGGKEKQCKR